MTKIIKLGVIKLLWGILGRKNFVRFARMLTNAGRLDGANSMDMNGEMLVVDTALRNYGDRTAPPVVIDCGANIGHYSIQVGTRARSIGSPSISLHAFEPASVTLTTLKKNLAAELPDLPIKVNQAALSNTVGKLNLHIVHDNAGVNSLLPTISGSPSRTETVSVFTLEDYCASSQIEKILLLKIDTEGNDYNVLEGAKGLLKTGSISLVQFEYNYRWIYARKYLRDVFDLARDTNMLLGKVTSKGIEFYSGWHPELESFVEGNYLLCTPEWKNRFPNFEWWGQALMKKFTPS